MAEKPVTSRTLKVKKGKIIQQKGEYNSKIYVVRKGLLRSYSIDKKGREHVFMFAPEGWVVGDAISVDEPSELVIQALEDSELLVREKDAKRDGTPKGFAALAKRLLVLQRRIMMMMSVTALERYEHFENTYPNLIQRVPQKMIAAYLGITPEALSKVRGQRLKK
ncbi:MAG: Crp/Fnr family transcriptional regulator [Bacteroidota bacterium]